ncbi:MAG: hypothetical protein ACFFCS_18815 [Candidatus Hodarchaeota archaeon]
MKVDEECYACGTKPHPTNYVKLKTCISCGGLACKNHFIGRLCHQCIDNLPEVTRKRYKKAFDDLEKARTGMFIVSVVIMSSGLILIMYSVVYGNYGIIQSNLLNQGIGFIIFSNILMICSFLLKYTKKMIHRSTTRKM